ncbi:MAG TPA: glycosyltransferase family 2 protein [Terriglobales bacterium]|jgi:glycosyltransferase involved in cell wall biosynthesis|nr:glycosyltransferase family 2 protein [Terriglobales bacterium]
MHWQIINWIAGGILALAWFSRIVEAAIGMPHVADIARPEWERRPATADGEPRVSIIVPARNEEEDIRKTLTQLLALDYSNYEVIAVNDRSTDRTGQMMDEVAASCGADTLVRLPTASVLSTEADKSVRSTRLKVIHIPDLPAGWLGKTHAMWTAGQQATGDWLLFTDADVLFKPDALWRAVTYAEAEQADHVVLFPRMIMKRPSETMMIAFFQALFVFGHRPWKVADPKARDHMGVGAFNMVRRSVYDKVGTYRALRMEVVDDMKLGKIVKNAGYMQRNVFGEDLISLRWAKGAFGIVNNLTKNFFAVLSFQWPRTVITIIGLGFLNLGPFLGVTLAHGWARLPYAIALTSLFGIYHGMSGMSAIPSYYFFLHPLSTSLFMYTLLRSMIYTLWNDGIVWRGTKYPLDELRKGMV